MGTEMPELSEDEEKRRQVILNAILNDEPIPGTAEYEFARAAIAWGKFFQAWYEEYILPIDNIFREFLNERLKGNKDA